MPTQPFNKSAVTGFRPAKGLVSYGLPLLLFLAFVGNQLINLDNIGWINGFTHPLTGWDHLLTMLAVGIWAAQLRGQAVWLLPLAFVSVMSLGGIAGASGLNIPSVEGIILLSCAVFSVLITRKVRFSGKINVLIVAFFAFFHGFAHGQEISTSASLISYTLGFMLATLLLHGAGILAAKLVIFSISCLLTFSVSTPVQANADESLDDIEVKKSMWVQTTEDAQLQLVGYRPVFFAMRQVSSCQDSHAADSAMDDGGSAAFLDKVDTPKQAYAQIPTKTNHASSKADGEAQALSIPATDFQLLANWPYLSLVNIAYLITDSLDFKHYYPDINHTPGKNLLSNGVGLTSPPASVAHVLVSSVLSSLTPLSFPVIADHRSQLTFAGTLRGNFRISQSFVISIEQPAILVHFGNSLPSQTKDFFQPIKKIISAMSVDTLLEVLISCIAISKSVQKVFLVGNSRQWPIMVLAINT
jgi:urease accessory protein